MTEGGPVYKREIDHWIKIMVIASPLLALAVSYGVLQAELSTLKRDVAEIKGWKDAQTEKGFASARETGEIISQLQDLNEKMGSKQVVNQLKDLNVKMGDVRETVKKKFH